MNKILFSVIISFLFGNIFADGIPGRIIVSDSIDVKSFSISPSETHLFATHNNNVDVFELATGKKVFTFMDIASSDIQVITLTRDSSYLIAGTKDGTLIIHDTQNNNSSTVKLHDHIITALAVDIKNKLVVAGNFEGKLVFLSLSGEIMHATDAHKSIVTDLVVLTEHKLVVSASFDGEIVKTQYGGELLSNEVIYKKNSPARAMAINSEATRFLAAFDNSWIYQFRINPQMEFIRYEKKRLSGWVTSVSYSHRNKMVWAVATTDGKIRIYTAHGEYRLDMNTTINQIYLLETEESSLSVIVSIYTKGVHLIHAKDMKLHP